MSQVYDVLIIGAGPSGLACSIAAKKRGISQLVLEQGGVADAIRRFPTEMQFYSTPEMLTIGGLPFTAAQARPSRAEALRYYRSVCRFHDLPLQLHTKILQARKEGELFILESSQGVEYRGKNLILATGYFDTPVPLDVPGEELPHVSHYYKEAYDTAFTEVLVVGGGNSAVDTALDLYRNGAKVTLVHRGTKLSDGIKYWTRPDIENRIKEGSIAAKFSTHVCEIRPESVLLQTGQSADRFILPAQRVYLLTGYQASLELVQQLSAECNFERGEPVHDGNYQTSVPGLFCAGSANCGIHTSEIFIENGRTHAERIIPKLHL